jgi:hypothetical protein
MPKLPSPTEHEVQLAIQAYLALQGHFCWRNNSGALPDKRGRLVRFGRVGSSDILGCHKDNGRLIALEIKRPGMPYKPTPAQLAFLDEITRRGGYAGIATSIDDVKAILGS